MKFKSIFFIFALIVLLWAVAALADDVTLTWEEPTGSETCTASTDPPNPAKYRIYQLVAEVPAPTTEYTFTSMLPGEYSYVASTVSTEDVEGRTSPVATKTVTTFKALAGSSVYQPVSIDSGFWMIPMGTVTADVDCDITQRVNEFYRVPVDAVTWLDGVDAQPVLVVASCK